MVRYIAFLRGINVSGQKIIKMNELSKIFTSFKLNNVKTYIQSGNILFDSTEKDIIKLTQRIEKGLEKALGYKVVVMLRTVAEMEKILYGNPFKNIPPADDIKMYIVFVKEPLSIKQSLPYISSKKHIEIFAMDDCNVFCISRAQNGKFEYPNAIIEKEFKIAATTRNWSTFCKMIAI